MLLFSPSFDDMPLPPGAAGAAAIFETAQAVGNEAVQAEHEEEIESMRAGMEVDQRLGNADNAFNRPPDVPESPSKVAKTNREEMSKHLKSASENVIVENTRAEYRR